MYMRTQLGWGGLQASVELHVDIFMPTSLLSLNNGGLGLAGQTEATCAVTQSCDTQELRLGDPDAPSRLSISSSQSRTPNIDSGGVLLGYLYCCLPQHLWPGYLALGSYNTKHSTHNRNPDTGCRSYQQCCWLYYTFGHAQSTLPGCHQAVLPVARV